MSKIWQVTANFEDWESTWFIIIGYFTKKSESIKIKEKWDGIFSEVLKMFEKPEDWDPKSDEYYHHPYYVEDDVEFGLPGTSTLYWENSREYEKLIEKYEFVKHLKGFQIDEFKLDEDVFLQIPDFNGENKKPLKNILLSLERDWKLKQITL